MTPESAAASSGFDGDEVDFKLWDPVAITTYQSKRESSSYTTDCAQPNMPLHSALLLGPPNPEQELLYGRQYDEGPHPRRSRSTLRNQILQSVTPGLGILPNKVGNAK